MPSEALFPRGPVSRSPAKKIDFKKRHVDTEQLFKLKKNSMKKKKADSTNMPRNFEKIVNLFQTEPDKITSLRYRSITEGLVIAGRIREINISRLGISLPGRALAHANVNMISTPYTSQLQSLSENKEKVEDVAALTDMFQIGEVVTVAVESITNKNDKYNVSVSLNPSDVNKTFNSSTIVENIVLVGAIKSVEDHGYVVDLGIHSVVAFLPKKNIDKLENEVLAIGKVVRTVILKVKRKSSKITVILSTKKVAFATAVPETGFSNTNILPGTQVEVNIIKVLPDGLVVRPLKTSEDVTGHVNLNHLPSSWDKTSRFKPGMTMLATLLYTIPHANIMYFSLWPQLHDLNPKRLFLDGALVKNAKVVALSTDGTHFQLGSVELNAKGVVSHSHAGCKDDFKVGDEHTVRIIQYDFMENVYVCSMKPEILSVEVYNANDLQVGQVLEAKVIKVIPGKGLTLKVGNITVFAPQFHLTDFPQMSQEDNVLSPLCKINAVVKAKVLCKNGDSCLVTLKPMLVKTPALCHYSEAKPGSCFYGTVKSLTNRGVVVWFYNNITGFIPDSEIVPLILKGTIHVGQSIKCYVTKVDPTNGKLFLTMTPKIVNKGYNLGSTYPLTVIKCVPEGLKVEISNTGIRGFLPFHQLSDHVKLLQPLKDHCTPGSKIKAAVAYSTDESSVPLFSLRSSVKTYFELNTNVTALNLKMQKDGAIVPCSIIEIVENGLNVDVCIPDSKHHFIAEEDILGYDEKILSTLSVNQAIMAVSSVQKDDFKLQLDKTQFYDISEVGFGIDLLIDYLKSSKLIQSVSLGDKTHATILKIKKKTVTIALSTCDSKGTISRKLCQKALKENDSIEVTILWQSPLTKVVHALPTEKQTDIEEEPSNEPKVGKLVLAKIVLVENDFAIGLISEGPLKSQIAFFPVKSHLNDLSPTKIQLYSTIHIIPVLLEKDYIVAIDEAKMKKHSQRTGKKMKIVLSELVKNADTFLNKRRTPVFLNVDEVENGISDELLKNGKEHESDSENKTPKKNKKKKKSNGLSPTSELSMNDEVAETLMDKSKVMNKKRNKQSLSSLSNVDDVAPSKVAKKKKSSLLNGDVESQLESSSGKKKIKSSLSQRDELDNSVSDSIIVQKEKKRKSCERDFNETNNQNNGSADVKKEHKKIKKKSLENTSTENADHSNQDGLKSRLSMQGYEGFSWSVDAKDFSITQGDNVDESEDEDDETADNSDKKGRSQMTASEKRAAAKESELRLRRAEQLLLEAESNPQSIDHFERLVLAHPNSSMLWIKYMAMHLQETEIDKARAVAKRALQVMNPREEEERLNVWTALLNLENLYGSEESLKSELAEAVRTNDDYQVYSKMLEIYADSKKTKSVEQLAAMMSKKFKSKLDCWLLCCRNLMRVGSLEKARSFFQRGLEALTKKDHVQFITRFALLENALGSFDHAQTVMDHVLMTYPGRIPAWTTYVDMLTKSGHIDLARQVLQRSINQKLPVKKMKTLYKKWLDFEQQHGTQANITHVKNLAEQYVNNLSLKIDDIQ